MAVAALAAAAQSVVSEAAVSPVWSAQQHSWLQAMGYTLYLHGSAMDAPEPVAEQVTAAPIALKAVPVARTTAAAAMPRKAPPPPPAEEGAAAPPVSSSTSTRISALRLPDRLQMALLRASGCDPNTAETRALMNGWPLAELRADPAAKRALWPQLRALRRKQRP